MLTFPHAPFRSVASFRIAPRNVSGSTSLSGVSQTILSGAALWIGTIDNINLRGGSTLLLWRFLEQSIMGRANAFLVPLCEGGRQPYPAGVRGPVSQIPHSDGTLFEDGTGYGQAGIAASLEAPVALGAVVASVAMTTGRQPEPGQYFSMDERLYVIRQITPLAAGRYTIGFWPPARSAVDAARPVEFDRPVCKVRLASDDEMQVDLRLNRLSTHKIALVEDLS